MKHSTKVYRISVRAAHDLASKALDRTSKEETCWQCQAGCRAKAKTGGRAELTREFHAQCVRITPFAETIAGSPQEKAVPTSGRLDVMT